MTNEEILQKILSGNKKLTAYYTYPTRGAGEQIFETNNWNRGSYDEPLKNVINLGVQLGAAVASCRVDNKTAVRVEVEGLDFPVYFRRFDGMYCISTDVSRRSGQEILISWSVGN
jgi:hypothetical protein